MANPWFRLYTEIIDDEKVRMLAFEDRWHFVALLCLKNSGYLDKEHKPGMFENGLSVKLGITVGLDLHNLKERLLEVDLIDDSWQPTGWDKRQFRSDIDPTRAERQRRYRERKNAEKTNTSDDVTVSNALRNGEVTPLETDTETYTDKNTTPNGVVVPCGPRVPDCPQAEILKLYREILPSLTNHVTWNGTRQKNLKARWRTKSKYQNLDWWRNFFENVATSDFLMGRKPDSTWQADLEWMVKPQNFAKIIDGKYHQ